MHLGTISQVLKLLAFIIYTFLSSLQIGKRAWISKTGLD